MSPATRPDEALCVASDKRPSSIVPRCRAATTGLSDVVAETEPIVALAMKSAAGSGIGAEPGFTPA